MTKKTNISRNLSALAQAGQQVENKVAKGDMEEEFKRLINQAEKLYDNNKNIEAIEKYEKALEIKPGDKNCKEQIALIKKKTYPETPKKPEVKESKPEQTATKEVQNANETEEENADNKTEEKKTKSTVVVSSDDYYSMFSQDEIDVDCRTVTIKLNRELHNALMERVTEAKRNVRGASLFNLANNVVRDFLRETDDIYEKSMRKQLKNKPY